MIHIFVLLYVILDTFLAFLRCSSCHSRKRNKKNLRIYIFVCHMGQKSKWDWLRPFPKNLLLNLAPNFGWSREPGKHIISLRRWSKNHWADRSAQKLSLQWVLVCLRTPQTIFYPTWPYYWEYEVFWFNYFQSRLPILKRGQLSMLSSQLHTEIMIIRPWASIINTSYLHWK